MPADVSIVSDALYYHQNKHIVALMLKVVGVVIEMDLMLVPDQTRYCMDLSTL